MFRTIFSTIFGHGAAATASAPTSARRGYNGLFVGIYSAPDGALLLDATPLLTAADFSTDEHGYADFNGTLPLTLTEQARIFDSAGRPHVRVTWLGMTVWEGRLQDATLGGYMTSFTAFGYRAALDDILYTNAMAVSANIKWIVYPKEGSANADPKKYDTEIDTGRLYATLKKGQTFTSAADVLTIYYDSPASAYDNFRYFGYSYRYNLPTGWVFRVFACNADSSFSSFASQNITTTGGTVSSSTASSYAFSVKGRVGVQIYYNGGGTYTNGNDDGVFFFEFLNPTIRQQGDATLTAYDVAATVIGRVTNINASQLSTSTALLQDPSLQLAEQLYEDARGSAVMNSLALLGDSQTPPRVWEWGVWNDRVLKFQPRGTDAVNLSIYASLPRIQRTVSGLTNEFYAKYKETSGKTLRTATSSDSASITRHGITVQGVVDSNTTNSTEATATRDMYLNEYKNPVPRSEIAITDIYDAAGNLYPKWLVKSGDNATAVNLPAYAGASFERARTFRIKRTRYDLIADRLEITPENDLPTLETMLANAAARI